ncbi:MAG: carbon-nitrogen hydrolase family protein [Pseudomonadota bacterium]
MQETFKAAAVQAAPEFMDLDAGVEKAIGLIKTAADNGARLVAFSECWLPGYPWWVWISPAAMNLRYFQRYHENCLVVDSPQFKAIGEAAKANGIYVSMGASERHYGTLYISQFLFDDEGNLIKGRRKLKPTHMERTVFGEGDGSDLEVIETDLGRIGQLNCWEHMQPLTKYAMYSMHEQLHIAAWPSFSCYPQAYALGSTLSNALSQVYAAEGQCFVLAPCGVVSQDMVDLMVETPEQAELLYSGGGFAQIFAPDGAPMCDPLPEKDDGLLFADIDYGVISVAKSFADPVGHYARPDVTRLLLNREARDPVHDERPPAASQPVVAPVEQNEEDAEPLQKQA